MSDSKKIVILSLSKDDKSRFRNSTTAAVTDHRYKMSYFDGAAGVAALFVPLAFGWT